MNNVNPLERLANEQVGTFVLITVGRGGETYIAHYQGLNEYGNAVLTAFSDDSKLGVNDSEYELNLQTGRFYADLPKEEAIGYNVLEKKHD